MDPLWIKDFLTILQPVASILALALGGIWSWLLVRRHRQRFPRASISHAIEQVPLDVGKTLVHVSVTVANGGQVLLSLQSAKCWIQQVYPVHAEILDKIKSSNDPVPEDEREVQWPLLQKREWNYKKGEAEVEPGEQEVLHCDFVVDSSIQAAVVYSYVKNQSKRNREIGWSQTSLVRITQ